MDNSSSEKCSHTFFLYIYSVEGYFFHNKNQSLIVHLMHFKVVNSTNINDPLTIFESQQFQNRQTDSKKQQQIVCMHFPTHRCVYNDVENGYLT